MYIIKHRSRRTADAGRTMWVVGGLAWCNTIEHAVDLLMELQADMITKPRTM